MLEPRQNRSSGCWKRKTKLEKLLIPCCVILCILTVLFLILYLTKDLDTGEICTTKHCVKASSEILDYADFKANPCQDFYKFTCGSFSKNAVKKQETTPLVTVTDDLKNELKAIIVDPIGHKNPHALVLLKQFYQQCMDEKKIDADESKAFLEAVEELGGWPLMKGGAWDVPKFNWVDWHIKATKLGLPIYGFFTFERVTTAAGNTILKVAGVSKGSGVYLSEARYNRIMTEVMEALNVTDQGGEITKQNYEVVSFKEKIRSLNLGEDSSVKTLEDLLKACPSVPWLKLLNSLAGDMNETFNSNSSVTYGEIDQYCEELDQLLNKTPPRAIANYFIWSILHQTYNYLSIRETYGQVTYETPSRFEICFKDADERFKYVKETVYVRKKTPKVVRDNLNEMIDFMKEVFKKHVEASDWMDDETKKLALAKTEHIQTMIGGDDEMYEPDFFDKLAGLGELNFTSDNIFNMSRERRMSETDHFFRTVYQDEDDDYPGFFDNMLKVNAFFVSPINAMILPAPILSSIFYDYRKPAFMNYGSIGRIIGHEIMHGFEKSGRMIATNDGMKDWWTNATADAYDKKVKCVIERYEKIPFRYRLNGTLTLDENVSDFVGIDVAYEAYLKYVEKYGPEQRIPGVPLTPEQIFWIQTGTWLCFRKLDDSDIDYEEEDEHAIPGFRVQAGARNSLYFAKDFKCPEGSFMNPKKKCRIF
ncbi:neprilysin-2-like isoform X2 [Harmonia axyridis]|uniref:neprilysin-2-like isoform X2 n=1 Tax=Harmonia axyridis TaxID=115357 RepID=UPI001E275C04|nr:neprilysin-2-like isoform X2 [Harmonia axyridis]